MSSKTVVVITGASSGIGRATALRFAARGATVVLASRSAEGLASLAGQCHDAGGEALAVPTDVTDAAQVALLARTAVTRFGRIDVWVNNAGVSAFAPFLDMPLDDFRRVLDVDIMGCVYGARAALAVMTEQGSGALINVSSIVGEVPQPYTAPYGMSKAAVRALGVSLRSELALSKQKGISVSTIMPATMDTPFFRHSANYTGREVVAMPPVYSPDLVARAIVKASKKPRREVVVGGPIAKAMVAQHRKTPAAVETQMALQTDKTHLSRTRDARPTRGTLYSPPPATDAAITGGWGGSEREDRRKTIGTLLAAALGVWLARRYVESRSSERGD
ncbi:SDR family oxidoreductase [Mycetocola zhujimingii]|uniref:SDR family oxidoreductase n=1 Tax=Mycetocola zhujimingii TaxID=2079792 RepID=UPI000D3457E0|nr:SDR family oxidoreductase [Mycetocola zhujimingii]AWB87710.1 short-chain dehydrogenase [Mycetocola zhujimingii]